MQTENSKDTTMSARPAAVTFHDGDEVVLARGTYQGSLGVFRHLNADARWADITERSGAVRSHPVEWLEHAA
jgi:hypothetical protein